MTCDWSHIIDTYKRNLLYPQRLKNLLKITPSHVYEKKIKKIKVSLCTQIFSVTMTRAITNFVKMKAKTTDGRDFDQTYLDTADFLLFMNDLFDSLNADNSTSYKNYKKAIRKKSPHLQLWQEAIEMFATMEFVPRRERDQRRPQVLRNFSDTLKGFICIRNKIFSGSANSFCTKSLNQDLLENLFGQIRQHGCRNNSPFAKSI